MQQRYCGNCGSELVEGQRFCGNCGTPVHEAARVPTPEADVPVPPPPQQHQQAQQPEVETRSAETRGPMLALLGVFLLVAVVGTVQGMAEANSNRDLGYKIGYGIGYSMQFVISGIAIVGVVVLILSVGGYLVLRGRGGLTFGQMVFSWPVVIVAGVVAAFYLFG